ncbi:Cnl2/NKP2 family protein-domain-containing protein [Clohesyomyces aquaticus]|uniref:Cnl2/NKP2 family protein-domain-containing protein n=1 Tax=Clohesyomyces aquaticus TaxID=1231657 RepID=A0A1Y1ZN76_9PLEO|nr:Cnl2/NKP2 family protein-domain-containing protein [Clohesyomyces aquaticus]
MPPSEGSILADFLLAPAPLRNCMSLRQFTTIFPAGQRDNPAIKDVYRELQRLRETEIDVVRRDIKHEVKKSEALKRRIARDRQQADGAAVAGLDRLTCTQLSSYGRRGKPHTLQSVHTTIEDACDGVEAQISELEVELQRVLEDVQEAVGGLSDLRYGHFPKSTGADELGDELLATLRRLEAACAASPG